MNKMPSWMHDALKLIGVSEIKGPKHNNTIIGWLDKLGAWWRDDETPWCGVFVAHCMHPHYPIPGLYMRAKAWLDWGVRIKRPVYGCVVVLNHKGSWHVGFVVGHSITGDVLVLAGNQGNRVSEAFFKKEDVIGYRLPKDYDYGTSLAVPIVDRRAGGRADRVV